MCEPAAGPYTVALTHQNRPVLTAGGSKEAEMATPTKPVVLLPVTVRVLCLAVSTKMRIHSRHLAHYYYYYYLPDNATPMPVPVTHDSTR